MSERLENVFSNRQEAGTVFDLYYGRHRCAGIVWVRPFLVDREFGPRKRGGLSFRYPKLMTSEHVVPGDAY